MTGSLNDILAGWVYEEAAIAIRIAHPDDAPPTRIVSLKIRATLALDHVHNPDNITEETFTFTFQGDQAYTLAMGLINADLEALEQLADESDFLG